MARDSDSIRSFLWHCKALKVPVPVPEFRFHPPRRWRFDAAILELKFAFECEGGSWVGGRHTRGLGFRRDCEKYGQAFVDGWTVVRGTPQMFSDGTVALWIKQRLEA